MKSASKNVEGKEVLNVQLVINDVKQPIFKAILDITYNKDPSSALSMIPPNVLIMQDIRKFYSCKISNIQDMEIRKDYDKLCDNGVLKEEFKIIEKKGLTRALDFLNVFKTKWIRIVLSRIHDSLLWLDNGCYQDN